MGEYLTQMGTIPEAAFAATASRGNVVYLTQMGKIPQPQRAERFDGFEDGLRPRHDEQHAP